MSFWNTFFATRLLFHLPVASQLIPPDSVTFCEMETMPMKFSFSRCYDQDRGEMASEVRRPSTLSWQLKAAGDNRGKAASARRISGGPLPRTTPDSRGRGGGSRYEGFAEGQLSR